MQKAPLVNDGDLDINFSSCRIVEMQKKLYCGIHQVKSGKPKHTYMDHFGRKGYPYFDMAILHINKNNLPRIKTNLAKRERVEWHIPITLCAYPPPPPGNIKQDSNLIHVMVIHMIRSVQDAIIFKISFTHLFLRRYWIL